MGGACGAAARERCAVRQGALLIQFAGIGWPADKPNSTFGFTAILTVRREGARGMTVESFTSHVLTGLIEQLARIEDLAKRYGVERKGPAGWGLELAYHLANEHEPGFSQLPARPKRSRGRPPEKTVGYRLTLAHALALMEMKAPPRGAKARLARELASIRGAARSRVTQRERDSLTRQYQNDISSLSEAERGLGIWLARRRFEGDSAAEIERKIALLNTEDLEIAGDVIREAMNAVSEHPHKYSKQE
jgi:hypothetical protein